MALNRAERRRRKQPFGELPDPRLWDHEPLQGTRWLTSLRINVPLEFWTSEQRRDAEWGAAHGWGFTYLPDGSKEALTATKTVRFPANPLGEYRPVALRRDLGQL